MQQRIKTAKEAWDLLEQGVTLMNSQSGYTFKPTNSTIEYSHGGKILVVNGVADGGNFKFNEVEKASEYVKFKEQNFPTLFRFSGQLDLDCIFIEASQSFNEDLALNGQTCWTANNLEAVIKFKYQKTATKICYVGYVKLPNGDNQLAEWNENLKVIEQSSGFNIIGMK